MSQLETTPVVMISLVGGHCDDFIRGRRLLLITVKQKLFVLPVLYFMLKDTRKRIWVFTDMDGF